MGEISGLVAFLCFCQPQDGNSKKEQLGES